MMPALRSVLRSLLLLVLFLSSSTVALGQSLDGCVSFILPPFKPVRYDEDIQPIFDRNCVNCHQPGGKGFAEHQLDLRPGLAHRNLVGKPSIQSPWTLVEPFNPDGPLLSYLWLKISCIPPPYGALMPPSPARLSGADARALYVWMLRGAPPGVDGIGRLRAIEAGHGGTWFDPSLPGHGFSFEVLPGEPSRFIAFWMTFDLQGNPLWLAGSGDFEPGASTVALTISSARGGFFDTANAEVSVESIGSAELTFASCDEGWLRYDIQIDQEANLPRQQRTIVLRRLTPSQQCESQAQ